MYKNKDKNNISSSKQQINSYIERNNKKLDSIEEGKRVLKEVQSIYRNPEVIEWKREYLERSGVCEFCNKNMLFEEKHINIARAHHINPISNYDDQQITSISDLAFICSNCHSLVHSARSNKELSSISKIEQKTIVDDIIKRQKQNII